MTHGPKILATDRAKGVMGRMVGGKPMKRSTEKQTAEHGESGWREGLFPVEVDMRGFVGSSTGRTRDEGKRAALCHHTVARVRGEGKSLALVDKVEQNMETSNS